MADEVQGAGLEKMRSAVASGQYLFQEGDAARDMYILLRGEVEIIKSNERVAVIGAPGSYVGEMSTLLSCPRTATVRTTRDSTFIVIPAEEVLEFFKNSPDLALGLARVLADRLRRTSQRLVDLGGEEII